MFIEERNNVWNTPYLFNAKELDEETGLYYYGARYYDPRTSIWLSTDPLQEMYPNVSTYTYVANNPIKFVDPDGRKIKGATKSDIEKAREDYISPLSNKKFDKFKSLISIKGKEFKSIKDADYQESLKDVILSDDEKTYTELLYNTINSKQTHTIEYLDATSEISSGGVSTLESFLNSLSKDESASYWQLAIKTITPNYDNDGKRLPDTETRKWTSAIVAMHGGGLCLPDGKGSHSLLSNSNDTQKRAINAIHELLGHGVAFSNKLSKADNNANAIRTDNLARRLYGIPNTQRDGTNHSDGKRVQGHTNLPLTK